MTIDRRTLMLQSGQLLDGRYKILEKLGEGAFGETYRASDQMRPSKPVCVVKRLKAEHTHLIVRNLFEKEAIVLEKLGEHPQIPRLLAHFTTGDGLFIVQEFVKGYPLNQVIQPGKPLSESHVIRLLQELLEILVFVHENGVIHRDIKPANVMRRNDGKLVLIDFGVVKELGSIALDPNGVPKTSVVAGTQGYMPFEQFKGKPGLYSDVYAVGMMAVEALTGIPPYHLPEDPETGEVIWRDRVQISDRLAAFLEKMVRDRYTQRYQTAAEALQTLNQPVVSPMPILQPQQSNTLRGSSHPNQPVISHNPVPRRTQQRREPSSPNRPVISPVPILQPQQSNTLRGPSHPNQLVAPPLPILQQFEFETVIPVQVRRGLLRRNVAWKINRKRGQAEYFSEDLGDGIMLEMVKIPGGKFLMGSPGIGDGRGNPQHQVTVPDFFMGKFAVTQAQYQAIVGNNPSHFKGEKRPVETVSWHDAVAFCNQLSHKTGRTYRLPSEAEWEYACRAGTTTPFHFGATITTDLANCGDDYTYASDPKGESRRQTIEVGSFPPNASGLYDMHGNVWEWCQGVYHANYQPLRGGSWYSNPDKCRSANRSWDSSDNRFYVYGFRVVLVVRIP